MILKMKPLFASLCVAGTLLLGGCNDSETQSQQAEAAAPELSPEQQNIAKYNVFVEAANGDNFSSYLDEYQKYYADAIKNKEPLENYTAVLPSNIERQRKNLEKALAMKGDLPELDATGKPLSEALAKLEPLNKEMYNYVQSKGFLSDKGKKAQEKDAAFIGALTEVVQTQQAFYEAIAKRDEINTRTAFENAEKDTFEYYRAGLVVYAKETMHRSYDFFESPSDKKLAAAFNESLDKLAEMAEGMNGKQDCSNLMMTVNSLLSNGRKSIADAAKTDFTPRPTLQAALVSLNMDKTFFNRDFDHLIGALNNQVC